MVSNLANKPGYQNDKHFCNRQRE